MCKKDEITKLSNEQTENLIKDIQESNLSERNKKLIGKIVGTVGWLCGVIDNQSMSIRKLKDWIFGAKTEKTKKIIKDDKDSHDDPDNNKNQKNSGSKKKRKGHGKNGADKYSNAPEIFYTDNKRNSGDRCSGCEKGNLYNLKPGTQLRFLGQAPLVAVIYRPQKLRCSSCGKVFTSDIPTDAGDTRSNGSANSMVALLKYGTGIPFYRLENLQNCLNIPIPASTQWDMVEKVADAIQPVHEKLMDFAAQSELIYVDDTGAKVLSIMKEIEKERKLNKKTRTGIFTTGMVAIKNNHQVNLFFTGRKHAGENLESLLRKRKSGLSPPIIMSDGLSRNNPKKTEIRHINCLVHSRRMYVDCHNSFPEETAYVITQLGLVYKNDCFCKDNNLKNNERLAYDQKNSSTIMEGIKEYISNKMKNKDIEPNSVLGNA
ncbi:transposase, partial [bacterium]|nr:transposase [bacterium]